MSLMSYVYHHLPSGCYIHLRIHGVVHGFTVQRKRSPPEGCRFWMSSLRMKIAVRNPQVNILQKEKGEECGNRRQVAPTSATWRESDTPFISLFPCCRPVHTLIQCCPGQGLRPSQTVSVDITDFHIDVRSGITNHVDLNADLFCLHAYLRRFAIRSFVKTQLLTPRRCARRCVITTF